MLLCCTIMIGIGISMLYRKGYIEEGGGVLLIV